MLLWTPEDLFLPIKPDLHLLLLLHPVSSGHPAVHSPPLISSMTFLIDALLFPSALVICPLISPLHFMSYCPSKLCSCVAAQVFFDGSSKHLLHRGWGKKPGQEKNQSPLSKWSHAGSGLLMDHMLILWQGRTALTFISIPSLVLRLTLHALNTEFNLHLQTAISFSTWQALTHTQVHPCAL